MGIKLVEVRGMTIGDDKPKVCIPLVGKTEKELVIEAKTIFRYKPDMIEWRVDYFNDFEDINSVKRTLNNIRNILPDYPMIFTCRSIEEGGYRKIEQGMQMNLIKEIIGTKQVDIVDIELTNGIDEVGRIVKEAHNNNIYVLVSYHNFVLTPSRVSIVNKLIEIQKSGCDIAKIAVMPEDLEDVINLLKATLEFKKKYAEIPFVTMAMSDKGVISRIAGYLFGSSITFAAGKEISAPGQIPIEDLRTAIEILLKYC